MSRHRISASCPDKIPPQRAGTAAPAERLGRVRRALAAGIVLFLSGCLAGQEDSSEEGRDPSTALSSAEEGQESPSGEETLSETADPIAEEDMAEILLTETEFPFSLDAMEELRGTDYFHEHIGVAGEIYVQNFGQQECARQMDTINERLVGEEPVGGIMREASRDAGAGDETVFVWILSYRQAPERETLWDEVLEACEGTVLEAETDQVGFSAFEQGGFRGMALDMIVDNGLDVLEMDGFSATAEYGNALLMVSAANMEAEDFRAVVSAQVEKLEAFDAAR